LGIARNMCRRNGRGSRRSPDGQSDRGIGFFDARRSPA
jgi:hypothetical protein